MEPKVLGILLSLSTVLVLLFPLVYGFSVHGRDLQSFMLPREGVDGLDGLFGDPGDISFGDESFDLQTGEIELEATFASDLDFDIILTKFSGDIYYEDGKVGWIELEEEVVLEASETTDFKLHGEVDQGLIVDAVGPGDTVEDMDLYFENMDIGMEFLGVEIMIEDYVMEDVEP